jgi:hypothetical protein
LTMRRQIQHMLSKDIYQTYTTWEFRADKQLNRVQICPMGLWQEELRR